MATQPIEKQFRKLLADFFDAFIIDPDDVGDDNEDLKLKSKLKLQLMLLEHPGLIVNMGSIDPEDFNRLIGYLWETDNGELFEHIYTGEEREFGMFLVSGFADRMKRLRPLQLDRNPKYIEFKVQLREAVNCFAHGLDTASVIMIISVLEAALKDKLAMHPEAYRLLWDSKGLPIDSRMHSVKPMVRLAKQFSLIDKPTFTKASLIIKLRNDAVHESTIVSEDESFLALTDCFDILKHLYQDESH